MEALAIMEELGLHQHEEYGSMLLVLGGLESDQGHYKEALLIYDKAKAVLAQHKEGNVYRVLLNQTTRNCNSGSKPLHATRKLLRR